MDFETLTLTPEEREQRSRDQYESRKAALTAARELYSHLFFAGPDVEDACTLTLMVQKMIRKTLEEDDR